MATETHRLAFRAMRTDFEFVLCGADSRRLRVAAEEARAEIEATDRELSAFSLGSLLNKVNREAGERPVKVPGRLLELFELCRRVYRDSGGAFDPSVAPLMAIRILTASFMRESISPTLRVSKNLMGRCRMWR